MMGTDQAKTRIRLTVRDKLSEIAADILTSPTYVPILRRIFECDIGMWFPLGAICQDFEELDGRVAALEERFDDDIYVMWSPFPDHGEGYCTVLFFVEPIHWTSLAIFNLAYFQENDTEQQAER